VQAAEFAALDPSRVIGKPVSENGPHRSAAEILVMEHDGAAGSRLGPAAALAGNVGRVRSELTKADSSLRSE
jgi:hypothetical protein